jgi:ferric-dicitrate binding protein FerR (iron transport regulator)
VSGNLHDYRELSRLLALLCDGSLTAAELEQLERRLLTDPEAQAFYHRFMALDADLHWTCADVPATLSAPNPSETLPTLPRDAAARVPDSLPFVPPHRGRHRLLLVAAGLAAALLIAALALWPTQRSEDPADSQNLARVVEVIGDAEILTSSGDAIKADSGRELFPGQTLRTGSDESYAVVEYRDATRLELTPDTVIRLAAGDKKVYLSQGMVRAEVPRQPKGKPMVLATPHAEIRVQDTRFASSIAPQATRVELEQGRLQFTRQADGQTIEVPAGFYSEVTAGLQPMVVRPMPQQLTRPRAVLNGSGRYVLMGPDGIPVASAGKRRIGPWDLTTGKMTMHADAPAGSIRGLARDPDGTTLALLTEERCVKVWGTDRQVERLRVDSLGQGFRQYALSGDGRWLALVDQATAKQLVLRVWNVEKAQERLNVSIAGKGVFGLTFWPDGNLLAGGVQTGKIILWNLVTGMEQSTIAATRKRVEALAFSPDGKHLASTAQDWTVTLWDVVTGQPVQTYEGPGRQFKALEFSHDGRILAAGTEDGSVCLWDRGSGKVLLTTGGDKGAVQTLAFSADSHTLATATGGGPIKLWDLPHFD